MFCGHFASIALPADRGILASLQQEASSQRLQRAMRYRKTSDQVRCLLSESLLKRALQTQGVALSDQRVQYNHFGKPALVEETSCFNVSHSGNWVVCAIDRQPVGIDVERCTHRAGIEFDELFTAREKHYLESGEKALWWQRFYRLWTLKESYLKALGTGLYQSMRSFTIDIIDESYAQLSINGLVQKDWYFYSFEPDTNHMCSICSRKPIATEQFHFYCIE